jgi:membrane-associated phospholipid phosphatase
VDLKVIEGTGPRPGSSSTRPRWGRAAPERLHSGESGLRPVDVLLLGYLLLTGLLILGATKNLPWWPVHLAGRLLAVVAILRIVPHRPRNRVLAFLRDWYPIASFIPLYTELGPLTRLFTTAHYDPLLVTWESALFGGQPSQSLRLLYPSPALSEYLHFAYFYYYFVPTTLCMWVYLRGERARFSRALTAILGVFLACCLIYLIFPVVGPYHYFGHPSSSSWPGFFGPLVHRIVDRGSSLGTAFPSSHTAVAVATWVVAWRLSRPAFVVLALIVPALALATVYGGFHYALDTLAGGTLGAGFGLVAPAIHGRLSRLVSRKKAQETRLPFASQGPSDPLR